MLMTRLRRSRLAGALVALGMLFYPGLLRDSSFSELLFIILIFRPHSLRSPAIAGQVEGYSLMGGGNIRQ